MKNNKLVISAAGSGKTTFLVNKALELNKNEQILISTYTIENEEEIQKMILKKRKAIPSNICIQGWFTFLIQHGVRPYQGAMNDILFKNDIKDMLLSEGLSGLRYINEYNNKPVYFKERDFFKEFYFTKNWKIYSDKISKFIDGCNKKINGEIISRLSRIYSHIYIDEIQDLAGYDLEIIKLLFKSDINIILVGDPRQVTYLTNHYRKYTKYKNGKIKEFLQAECKDFLDKDSIDESTLKKSHRNNKSICDYSSKLYPEFEKSEPCDCKKCRSSTTVHNGVFIVKSKDVSHYIKKYKPIQLIWNKKTNVDPNSDVFTFGKSKGKTFDRVIIYPTPKIISWIQDNTYDFTRIEKGKKKKVKDVREKFYVALTRAKYSIAIVYDYKDNEVISDVEKYN